MKLDAKSMEVIMSMQHSRLMNYVVPGLESSLLGGSPHPSKHGCVRMFVSRREQREHIVPHSHRFDLACLVLSGWVANTIWHEQGSTDADCYHASDLIYNGSPGSYEKLPSGRPTLWVAETTTYRQGDWYSMTSDQIHSIVFSRNAKVLFFEGPEKSEKTTILEPVVDGRVVPTFKVEPWMFDRGVEANLSQSATER